MSADMETIDQAAEQQNHPAPKAADAAVEAPKAERPVRKTAAKVRRKAKAAASKPKVKANERNDEMKKQTNDIFAALGAFPGAAAFEKLFSEAAERGEEAVKRSRKTAEEFADLYRGNIDAFVEAGRIAASGAQSISQDFVAKSRDGLEQTANTVRSFVEAKSPTELLQLQGDFARTAFDRFVEESSALTESVVKLAGEAFQPISNRASANVEKLNQISA
jgi:phasin family protein